MHKILLVEDDQVIRQQVGKFLSEWGFEVVLVEDFMEVLSLFVQSEPHLVLMDIGLPLFNGYHWCQEIRKISKVPIMFLSSRDQAMDIVMAINMGADDFVTKPFDHLETVLESLTAGVITLDEAGRLKTLNRSAENILGLPLSELSGSNWHDWPQSVPQYLLLTELFQTILATEDTGKPVQTAYTGGDEARILLAKATPLPADNGGGTVLVFDDITLLVRAQKEAAWGEVAKRLAHEIRNPLTPIQLSAERLAWKLQDKLGEQDAQILARSTDTIIKQVAAMKEMVEAFRNYARAPALKLEKQDLNKIIEEVLLLYEAGACTFDAVFSNIPAVMYADATAMRQVLHNIFKNAAEAAEEAAQPQVHIHTANADGQITLTVANNGKSFGKDMLANAFEPYVTDKPTGTGLGLPVVKKIVEEHGGRIALSNPAEGGACVKITLPALVEEHYEK